MSDDIYGWEDEPNVGLAFGKGFFCRSDAAVDEDTSEVMSYFIPEYNISVQAFLVDDFSDDDEIGFEIIPHALKGVSYIRISRSLWEFIEDVAGCEHESSFFQGLVLGELLTGTAHRMVYDGTGQMPGF